MPSRGVSRSRISKESPVKIVRVRKSASAVRAHVKQLFTYNMVSADQPSTVCARGLLRRSTHTVYRSTPSPGGPQREREAADAESTPGRQQQAPREAARRANASKCCAADWHRLCCSGDGERTTHTAGLYAYILCTLADWFCIVPGSRREMSEWAPSPRHSAALNFALFLSWRGPLLQ